jgi:hypothetical protein
LLACTPCKHTDDGRSWRRDCDTQTISAPLCTQSEVASLKGAIGHYCSPPAQVNTIPRELFIENRYLRWARTCCVRFKANENERGRERCSFLGNCLHTERPLLYLSLRDGVRRRCTYLGARDYYCIRVARVICCVACLCVSRCLLHAPVKFALCRECRAM